jgi:hypothetical protein
MRVALRASCDAFRCGEVAVLAGAWVIRTESFLANPQGSAVQEPGLLIPAHSQQRLGCIGEVDSNVGVVGTKGRFVNAQCQLV